MSLAPRTRLPVARVPVTTGAVKSELKRRFPDENQRELWIRLRNSGQLVPIGGWREKGAGSPYHFDAGKFDGWKARGCPIEAIGVTIPVKCGGGGPFFGLGDVYRLGANMTTARFKSLMMEERGKMPDDGLWLMVDVKALVEDLGGRIVREPACTARGPTYHHPDEFFPADWHVAYD